MPGDLFRQISCPPLMRSQASTGFRRVSVASGVGSLHVISYHFLYINDMHISNYVHLFASVRAAGAIFQREPAQGPLRRANSGGAAGVRAGASGVLSVNKCSLLSCDLCIYSSASWPFLELNRIIGAVPSIFILRKRKMTWFLDPFVPQWPMSATAFLA